MRQAGFEPEDYADDFFDVWPDSWPAVGVFLDIHNQWRTDMAGPCALDYGVLFHQLDRLKLADDDYEQMFQDVRQLERGALAEIRKKKTGTHT